MLQLIELEEAVEGSVQAAPAESALAATDVARTCSQPSLHDLAAMWADGQHHLSVATDRCVPQLAGALGRGLRACPCTSVP